MADALIQPWDAGTVHAIEKAIQKTNLGLNPMVDKKHIRIVLPELRARNAARNSSRW